MEDKSVKDVCNAASTSHHDTQLIQAVEELMLNDKSFERCPNAAQSGSLPVFINKSRYVHVGPKIIYCQHPVANSSAETAIDETLISFKEKLKNYYKRRNAYMRSLFWDGKRLDLPIQEYFFTLTLRETDLLGKKRGENILLEDVFLKDRKNQTILITGDPGYGKTTLCNKIAYDWSTGEQYLQHFDFVIVITLREMQHSCIGDKVVENIFGNAKDELKADLRKAALNFLVILDGLNEIMDKTEILKFVTEDYIGISSQMTILITSRFHCAEIIREDMDVRYVVHGFTQERQHEYVRKIFELEEGKAESLIRKLQPMEICSGLAECPLLLHMLCCLHRNEDLCFVGRRTDLYIRMFSLLIKRYQRKNAECKFLKKGKYFWGEDLLLRLGNLALYSDGHFFQITSKVLREEFSVEEEYNFIIELDLLAPYSISDEDDILSYEFVHSTFQEFLSAFCIYEISKENLRFNCPVSNNILLFLLGIAKDEPFVDSMQYFSSMVFSSRLMKQAHREIESRDNWKRLCSVAKILFRVGELEDLKNVFTLFQFTRIYLCLPENQMDCEKLRDELIDFNNNYNFLNKLEIYLFLNKTVTFFSVVNLTKEFHDIRQSATLVIDFLCNIQLDKFNIYFCGLTDCGGNYVVTNLHGNFEFFRFVVNPLEISKEIKNDFGISEDVASLQVLNFSKSFTTGDLIMFGKPMFINYLISVEQYEKLKYHVKTFAPMQPETYRLFYACDPLYSYNFDTNCFSRNVLMPFSNNIPLGEQFVEIIAHSLQHNE